LQGSTVFDATTITAVSADGTTATVSPGAKSGGTASLSLGPAVVSEPNVASPATTPAVPGVHYVYNVIDTSSPNYLNARALVGYQDQSGAARSTLCDGSRASTINDNGFLDLPPLPSAGGNTTTCRLATPGSPSARTASQVASGGFHTCAIVTG